MNTAKKITIPALLLLGCAITFLLGVKVGAVDISWHDIFTFNNPVINQIRVPRLILGAMTGASLAVSGALLQGVMRNSLAAPEIIGVSSGGALAAVIVLAALPEFSQFLIPASFAGALAAAIIIYLIAWKNGSEPLRLILSGVAVSALLSAAASAVMIYNSDKISGVLNFLSGSLSGGSWEKINAVWPYMTAGMALALLYSRSLNILALGDDTAAALGVQIERIRFLLLAAAAMLAAASVSAAGLLGFVGLVAPHIARMTVGSDNRSVVISGALFGALLVMLCDTAGRWAAAPRELPAGIVMAMIGAPFFLYLLRAGRCGNEN